MKKTYLLTLLLACLLGSCKQEDEFLSSKPNQSLALPDKLDDLAAMLKREELFNDDEPVLGTITADDDFFITTDTWNQLFFATERNAYIFQEDIYENDVSDLSSWKDEYEKIYVANTVLEKLELLPKNINQGKYNEVKGTALFYRGLAFYNLSQHFGLSYNKGTAEKDLGIPLRMTADFNETVKRATVAECYRQIFADLEAALLLVPKNRQQYSRPHQASVLAILARICLAISEYEKAFEYAQRCLKENVSLTDFSKLTPTASTIHQTFLEEDLYHSMLRSVTMVGRRVAFINPALYNQYEDNDLRKSLYFSTMGTERIFRGTFDFRGSKFSGPTVGEVYLIRAECLARKGNVSAAVEDMNTLLMQRYKPGTYQPYVLNNPNEVLPFILRERRKELVFRGLRWTDIKRLNKENAGISISRSINGKTYTLPPNDPKYIMPIPKIEVLLSGIEQNKRN